MTSFFSKIAAWYADFKFVKFAQKGDDVLKFFARVFVFMLVFWILWAFRQAYKNDAYTLSAFNVPPSLEARGYSGTVVVDKIVAEMQAILSKRYFDEQNPEAYRRINTQPTLQFNTESRAGYFDLRALFQMGKLFLGKKDKTIRGHITLDTNVIRLSLLLPDEAAYPLSISSRASLDSLFHRVAVHLIRQTTPQYLVYYYLDKQDYDEAEKLLDEIDFKLNNERDKTTYTTDRIQWYLAWTNFLLAKKDYPDALQKIDELQKLYPKDLAGYAQKVNILFSQVVELENQNADKSTIKAIAQQATELAQLVENQNLSSSFLDKKMAQGWLYSNWAYMLQKVGTDSTMVLEKYRKAIELLPQAAASYNNLSYFYMDSHNYAEAEIYLKKAILADPKDGNSWDTYAELMLIKGDTLRFYNCIEQALKNHNPTEGVSAEGYAKDARWQKMWGEKRFENLLKKYKPN
jgi:tetratricopeptide (TPR) repeat protein